MLKTSNKQMLSPKVNKNNFCPDNIVNCPDDIVNLKSSCQKNTYLKHSHFKSNCPSKK